MKSEAARILKECAQLYREHQATPHELRRWQSKVEPPPLRLLTPAEIAEEVRTNPLGGLLDDPVRSALRGRVRDVGWLLFVRGGLKLMEDTLQLAEETSEPHTGAIVDKWFSGIGDGTRTWEG